MLRLATILLIAAVQSSTAAPSCGKVDKGVCLNRAKPILKIITTPGAGKDEAACCAACLALKTCVSWNVNSGMDKCFLRAVAGPSNKGAQCTSGQIAGRSPSPAPGPSPGPSPGPGPTPPPPPSSDQRPRFHFAPAKDATNDVQGPFYDPRHKLYHMGFAWHVNGTHGISSAPNRWWHGVSRDLAHWKVVSTTPELAMLSPGIDYAQQPPAVNDYDDLAAMTGSVTIDTTDGNTPKVLYAARGTGNRAKHWSSATVALAQASNLSDPLLTRWAKQGVVLNPGFKPAGMPVSHGFRDPSTAWRAGGLWRVLTACQQCNGSSSMLGLFSAEKLEGPWQYTSDGGLSVKSLECPDFWPLVMADGGDNGGLSAIKLSEGGKEVVYVGTMDADTMTLTNIVAPLVPNAAKDKESQLLDAKTYASKSFYDPVHKQQVWTSWIHEGMKDSSGGCANATVCSTHTLPRALAYDREIKAHVTPPVPQTSLLRGELLHAVTAPKALAPGSYMALPNAEKSGMQLEIEATFALPLPAGTSVGFSVRRSAQMQNASAPSGHAAQPLQYTESVVSVGAPSGDGAGSVGNVQTTVWNCNGIVPAHSRPTPALCPPPSRVFSSTSSISYAMKPGDTNITLRVFVDHSVIETYAQGGRGVVTSRTYPTDDALGAGVVCNGGGAKLLALKMWQVHSIWIDEVLPALKNGMTLASSAAPPRRVVINGSTIYEPELPLVPTKLRGFNFWVALDQPIESMDTAVTDLLPGTNMARLVMVHWQDAESIAARGSDCYTANHPFIKPACLKQFDDSVAWATGAGLWTILTGRAKGGPGGHVFDNDTLSSQMIEMWSFLAARYANVSNILGYEVFSEPRTLNATQVHQFHVDACGAVWDQDPRAACLIGAGKFYDRYQLDERYIIKGKPVIYAANYLSPKKYTKGALRNITYPGSKIKCGDLLEAKEVPHACPSGDAEAVITFDKEFLGTLAEPFSEFQKKFNVPLWVDQWGIFGGGVGGGNASITAYMEDALDLWEQGGFLWTQWIWRAPYAKNCSTYGLVCQPVTCGSFYPQAHLLKPLNKYLGGNGSVAPLPTSLSPLCQCINDAKEYCATAADCKKCVFQHRSELEAKGCDWKTHSEIIDGACPPSPPTPL